jgi:AcrR family transcriptional regulator
VGKIKSAINIQTSVGFLEGCRMAEHNRHWLATHHQLQTITFHLLKTTAPEAITVSQLCAAAHINRSTFYAHYQDVFDLVDQTQSSKRQELLSEFAATAKFQHHSFLDQTSLQEFLLFIRQNGWFYQIVLRTRNDFPIQEGFDQLYRLLIVPVKKRHPEISDDEALYYFVAFQSSFTMILRRWSENNYDLAPNKVATIIINSLPYLLHANLYSSRAQ